MQEYLELSLPDYTIKSFTEGIYSICKFKRNGVSVPLYRPKDECIEHDSKLDQAYSRARSMVLQYGLCNDWDWFVTLTLDKTKYDRFDLDEYSSDLSQFVRDCRKRYSSSFSDADRPRLSYLLVPEMHKDGAWHMHGFIAGIPSEEIGSFIPGVHPQRLVKGGFKYWISYNDKFGFCSLASIRDSYAAVLYVSKYINKSVEDMALRKGKHLYLCSRPLRKAERVSDVYGSEPELDKHLDWHGKFCSTGMVKGENWVYPYAFSGADYDCTDMAVDYGYSDVSVLPRVCDFKPCEVNPFVDYNGEQLNLKEVFV